MCGHSLTQDLLCPNHRAETRQAADLTSSLQVQCLSQYVFNTTKKKLLHGLTPWPSSDCAVCVDHWAGRRPGATEEPTTAGCWEQPAPVCRFTLAAQASSHFTFIYTKAKKKQKKKHNLHSLWNYYNSTFERIHVCVVFLRSRLLGEQNKKLQLKSWLLLLWTL